MIGGVLAGSEVFQRWQAHGSTQLNKMNLQVVFGWFRLQTTRNNNGDGKRWRHATQWCYKLWWILNKSKGIKLQSDTRFNVQNPPNTRGEKTMSTKQPELYYVGSQVIKPTMAAYKKMWEWSMETLTGIYDPYHRGAHAPPSRIASLWPKPPGDGASTSLHHKSTFRLCNIIWIITQQTTVKWW
jgi:hypothetical protein